MKQNNGNRNSKRCRQQPGHRIINEKPGCVARRRRVRPRDNCYQPLYSGAACASGATPHWLLCAFKLAARTRHNHLVATTSTQGNAYRAADRICCALPQALAHTLPTYCPTWRGWQEQSKAPSVARWRQRQHRRLGRRRSKKEDDVTSAKEGRARKRGGER